MNRALWIIALVWWILPACKSTKQHTPDKSSSASSSAFENGGLPSWVKSRPKDGGHYYGVGSAIIIPGSSAHFDEARNQALNQIAGEIQTKIESKSLLTRFESDTRLRENYFTEIKAKVNVQVEAYEKVDDANSGSRYYVLYRLNRAEYWRKIEEARMAAIQRAASLVKHGEELLNQGLLLPGMQSLFRALKLLEPYADKQLTVQVNGQNKDLAEWISGTMSKMLTGLSLELSPKVLELSVASEEQDALLSLNAQSNGVGVANLPISWRLSFSGTNTTREVPGEPTTNASGLAQLRLPEISRASALVVSAQTSPLEWFHDSIIPAYTKNYLMGFTRSATARVTMRKPRIFLQVAESNLGQSPDYPIVQLMVQEYLEKHGFVLVSDANKAEVNMEVESTTESGTQQGGIYIAYATLTFRAVRIQDNTPLFNKVIERLKGADLSFQAAGRRAISSNREEILKALDGIFGL